MNGQAAQQLRSVRRASAGLTAVVLVVATLSSIVGVVSARSVASAHNTSNWLNARWAPGTTSIGIRGGPLNGIDGVTAWNVGAAARHAGNAWDNVPNLAAPTFDWVGTTTANVTGDCSVPNAGEVLIGSGGFHSSYLMTTNKCWTSGLTINRASIRVFTRTNFEWVWMQGGDTNDSDEFDLQGVFTHEFGHVLGWGGVHLGHTAALTYCPNNDDRHTMCPLIPGGRAWWQTLEDHDVHTVRPMYAGGSPF